MLLTNIFSPRNARAYPMDFFDIWWYDSNLCCHILIVKRVCELKSYAEI
jgi:hypothetical protein